LTLARSYWLKALWLVRFYWLRTFWYERRFRRRAERRVAGLRSLPSTLRATMGVAGAFVFGLALGAVVVHLAIQQRPTREQPIAAVPIGQVAAEPARHEADAAVTDVAVAPPDAPDALAAPEFPEARAAAQPAAERTAVEAVAERPAAEAAVEAVAERPAAEAVAEAVAEPTAAEADAATQSETKQGETENASGGLAAASLDDMARPPVSEAGASVMDMPSVEQGPPAEGDVAGPPKQTRVAGLPIPPKPQWLRNAVRTRGLGKSPMIAVIIDDAGVNQRRTREAVRLPGPMTIAFIPYGFSLREHVAAARRHGHEIMVHLPMEPVDPGADPGPNALLTDLAPAEVLRRLRWGLEQFDGYVGVSNHMGSRFTVWEEGMRLVMREVRSRGLLFVDSWTHNRSLGMPISRRFRVPNAARDIFIDHDITEPAIRRRLGLLEKIARRRGYAVGIAHPHRLSMQILEEWTKAVQARGFRLVPISAVVRHRLKRR
jgi:polysaccharide deacetylase 2 family uncharacterized protein YibQ